MGLKEERRQGCPSCGSRKVAEILWGFPAFTEDVEHRHEKGELVFGGCVITVPGSDMARWECLACGSRWLDRARVEFPAVD